MFCCLNSLKGEGYLCIWGDLEKREGNGSVSALFYMCWSQTDTKNKNFHMEYLQSKKEWHWISFPPWHWACPWTPTVYSSKADGVALAWIGGFSVSSWNLGSQLFLSLSALQRFFKDVSHTKLYNKSLSGLIIELQPKCKKQNIHLMTLLLREEGR